MLAQAGLHVEVHHKSTSTCPPACRVLLTAARPWPAQYQRLACSSRCRAAVDQPGPGPDSQPANSSGNHSTTPEKIQSTASDPDKTQIAPQLPGQAPAAVPVAPQTVQQRIPQVQSQATQQQQQAVAKQQLGQQQQQQQQQPQQRPPSSTSSSSSSSKPRARKQKPRQPFFLVSWIQTALAALRRTPRVLLSFLAGGVGAACLLYGWARGSPLKRQQPYRFTMLFKEASKVDAGTPVRMKGVQIGNITSVTLHPAHVEAVAEVADSSNIIPHGSKVDINLLGLAADPWIDITPPANAVVRKDHGPHHPACAADGLIVCHNGTIHGQLGGSTDFMMKFFLSQHDRTRVKMVEPVYHSKNP